MGHKNLMVMVIAALVAVPVFAHAESLADKEKKAPQNKTFQENLQSTNEACGTAITGSIDWTSIAMADLDAHGPAGYCDEALAALRSICGTADGKSAVKEKIKKATCGFGGKGKRAVTIKAGTMHYAIDWSASNNQDFVETYLKSNL